MSNLKTCAISFMLSLMQSALADNLISLFPIQDYDQNIATWINPNDPHYNQSLLSPEQQQQRLQEFYRHYFDSSATGLSPWSQEYVTQVLHQPAPGDIQSVEISLIQYFSNDNKDPAHIGYGENFRPHTQNWLTDLANNINIAQFTPPLSFNANNRAITTMNLDARILPTTDPHFYSHELAGQGYPFDNLQMSSVWAGTPIYVLGTSVDGAWDLILTPNLLAWVNSNGIAYVDDNFVHQWQTSAQVQLVAITHTSTPIIDTAGIFRFSAYVGAVFPSQTNHQSAWQLMIPIRDSAGKAQIAFSAVAETSAAQMPLTFTPHHFADVISSLIGRPYGWGGYYFYNDCSQELKSIFTPFAIWLPRHSSDQVNAGVMVDMSTASMAERIHYLLTQAHPLTTIVYIGGHVFLYVGKYPDPTIPAGFVAETYQNVWGLSPADNSRRAVIGGAVFLPLLTQYKEDPTLASLANKKYFQVSYLDAMPTAMLAPPISVKSLMWPDH